MEDSIVVSGLELLAHVGVTAAERQTAQRVTLSLRLVPERGFTSLADDIANTVDYAAVCETVRREAGAKPRRLIETLAGDVATLLLKDFPLRAVEVEVRKYALPNADYAAVHIRRKRTG
jgi:dihydroneopterin aldolase